MENDAKEDDWIIDAQGFYMATRSFLMRRGYCCGNQCRNCPYINWRHSPTWTPVPAEMVLVAQVSRTVLDAIRRELVFYEQQAEESDRDEILRHYRLLVERWDTASSKYI